MFFDAHIVYAFILTAQNRSARGNERYAVNGSSPKVEWASKNMLVLGIIVLLGILLHLFNFWYNMMFAEIVGFEGKYSPTAGYSYIVETFKNPVFVVLYIVWLCAIWYHLSHGFWSAMQTLGINGKIWFKRWKMIGLVYTTLLMLGFLIVVLAFTSSFSLFLGLTKRWWALKLVHFSATGPSGIFESNILAIILYRSIRISELNNKHYEGLVHNQM